MHNKLKMILKDKKELIAKLKQQNTIQPHTRQSHKSFEQAISQSGLNVIAEVKRRSPSRGDLATIADPVQLAKNYATQGASAVSVLTDAHFSGTIEDLTQVTQALKNSNCCVLRKDFVIDTVQIDEAIKANADAILLIVAVLQRQTKDFLHYCQEKNIDALVEVHTEADLEIALAAGAKIIGVNNRDLTTFEVDTQRALEIKQAIPADKVSIAESGIFTAELANNYQLAGFNAILVGEALVTTDNPGKLIKEFRGNHG